MYFINTFLTLLEHAGTHTPVSLKLIFYLISFLKCWKRRREKKVVKNLNRFFPFILSRHWEKQLIWQEVHVHTLMKNIQLTPVHHNNLTGLGHHATETITTCCLAFFILPYRGALPGLAQRKRSHTQYHRPTSTIASTQHFSSCLLNPLKLRDFTKVWKHSSTPMEHLFILLFYCKP